MKLPTLFASLFLTPERPPFTLLDIARLFLHVKELPGNLGARVTGIIRWSGGLDGQPWCCYFVSLVLDLYYGGKAPFPRTGDCDVVLALAQDKKMIVSAEEMRAGDIYLRLPDPTNPTNANHIGFCTSSMRLVDGKPLFGQLSGNTSEDGMSVNGDRVAERDIKYPGPAKMVFVRLPAKK